MLGEVAVSTAGVMCVGGMQFYCVGGGKLQCLLQV